MKKMKYSLIVLMLLTLGSCEKANQETPGNIPGMGFTPGELAVKEPFSFPQGVILIDQITGYQGDMTGYSRFGSGYYVKLKMTLLNSTNEPKTVFFTKGLIFKSDSPEYQNGMLLQTTWISIGANSERKVMMDLYCLNRDLPGPDENATYTILGTTGSKIMGRLLDLIKWRKINYEMIYGTFPGATPGTSVYTYKEITDRFQEIIHDLTYYGRNISADDKEFIESIPELTPVETPEKDSSGQYPAYFNEFEVPGN